MGRQPRYLPKPGTVVEITHRTIQGRFLLRPGKQANKIIVGVLAQAQALLKVKIHAVAVLSNHHHILASFDSLEQMSGFMRQVATGLSKELGRLHDWPGCLFDGRFHAVPVTDEVEAQCARLKYVLSQGCKEKLVRSPEDWPGVHCAQALTRGHSLDGLWIRRTAFSRAKQKQPSVDIRDFISKVTLELTPLPCLAHLSREEYRVFARGLVDEIVAASEAEHRIEKTSPAGAASNLAKDPHYRPQAKAQAPIPLVHSHAPTRRKEWLSKFREFIEFYRRASRLFLEGDLATEFPPGCFLPRPAPTAASP